MLSIRLADFWYAAEEPQSLVGWLEISSVRWRANVSDSCRDAATMPTPADRTYFMAALLRACLVGVLVAGLAACADESAQDETTTSTTTRETTAAPPPTMPATTAAPVVPETESALTIMPIGDSITQSETGAPSYRCFLDTMLHARGVSFDFVGSRQTPFGGDPYRCPREFDPDHEGYWGGEINQAVRNVTPNVERLQPDVALIHLGTNDIGRGDTPGDAANELGSFISGLQATQPEITILVAQLIPCDIDEGNNSYAAFCAEAIPAFNEAVADLSELSTATSTVSVVDMYTGYDPTHFRDALHPSDEGYVFMAERWLEALVKAGVI